MHNCKNYHDHEHVEPAGCLIGIYIFLLILFTRSVATSIDFFTSRFIRESFLTILFILGGKAGLFTFHKIVESPCCLIEW